MKYLKKYNEAKAYIENSPMRSDIQEILLELNEDKGLKSSVQIYEEDSFDKSVKNIFCKVCIYSDHKFEYPEIEESVERLKDYMTMDNFYVKEFTSTKDITGEQKPLVIIDSVSLAKRAYFVITFKNIPSVKEELKSDVYKSASDKLIKIGHTKKDQKN